MLFKKIGGGVVAVRMRAGLLCTGVKKRATMARNPWASKDFLLGVRLGDPTSGLVIARRCGLQGIEVEWLSSLGEAIRSCTLLDSRAG